MFVVVEGWGFPGRPDRNNSIHPAFDLGFNQTLEGGLIDLAVAERRDNRGIRAGKHDSRSPEHPRSRPGMQSAIFPQASHSLRSRQRQEAGPGELPVSRYQSPVLESGNWEPAGIPPRHLIGYGTPTTPSLKLES